MHVYEFGDPDSPAVLLIPGTCCHWKRSFSHVIDPLAKNFRVACISFTGFDEADEGGPDFDTITAEVERIEDYVTQNHGGHVRGAYGCSLGGSLVGLLVARGNIHIDQGILGSSDLDQASPAIARIQTALVGRIMIPLMQNGQFKSTFMQKRLEKSMEGNEARQRVMGDLFGIGHGGLPFVSAQSIKNQFYSDLVTPLPAGIDVPDSQIHVFYALKMGEKYRARYLEHFAHPVIHEQDMGHEEFFACHPEEWAALVTEICGCRA